MKHSYYDKILSWRGPVLRYFTMMSFFLYTLGSVFGLGFTLGCSFACVWVLRAKCKDREKVFPAQTVAGSVSRVELSDLEN